MKNQREKAGEWKQAQLEAMGSCSEVDTTERAESRQPLQASRKKP